MDVVATVSHIATWQALATAGLLCGLMVVYRVIFGPYSYYADEAKHAYFYHSKPPPGMSKESAVQEIKRNRKVGEIPPVYPNGWFVILRSEELGKKETKYVNALGLHLAVFRGDSGKVYIVDAYCPHLGANLAVGGKVVGECIRCPFHGWTFRGDDGKCVKIVYSEQTPPSGANVGTHHSLEINTVIMIWYHAEKEEPSWYPPEIEGVKKGQNVRSGFLQTFIETHIQDVAENGGDIPHLNYLHAPQVYDKYYTGDWQAHPTEKHRSCADTAIHTDCKNPLVSTGGYKIKSEQYGPSLFFVTYRSDVLLVTCTPVQPLRQKVSLIRFRKCGFKYALFNKLQMSILFTGLQDDIVVWAHKTYISRPPFVKEDNPTARHRKWYAQFYTEHSPRYVPEDPLQW